MQGFRGGRGGGKRDQTGGLAQETSSQPSAAVRERNALTSRDIFPNIPSYTRQKAPHGDKLCFRWAGKKKERGTAISHVISDEKKPLQKVQTPRLNIRDMIFVCGKFSINFNKNKPLDAHKKVFIFLVFSPKTPDVYFQYKILELLNPPRCQFSVKTFKYSYLQRLSPGFNSYRVFFTVKYQQITLRTFHIFDFLITFYQLSHFTFSRVCFSTDLHRISVSLTV